jgi:hypothetical protein
MNFRKIILYILIINCSLLIVNCSKKLDPEPLSLKVRQNLALLQQEPQFVMYFNFIKMRETGFWKAFVSDSLFSGDRNFGGILSILNQSTGATISNGIDEIYFSNSWLGENAIVVKGIFDRKRVNEYISNDSLYSKINYPNGIIVYKQTETNFNFYFKDDFTLCASNYLKHIENTFLVADTSQTGLLANTTTIKEIERIKFKDNLWMFSNQKLFIRGIFENFADMGSTRKKTMPGAGKDSLMIDTTDSGETGSELVEVYRKIAAVSISVKMTDAIELVMQNECEDVNSAGELKTRIEGIVALAKLSSTFTKKKPSEIIKLLDKLEIDQFDKTVLLNARLNENEIKEIRKEKIF